MRAIKILLYAMLGIISIPAFIFALVIWCFIAPFIYLFKNVEL